MATNYTVSDKNKINTKELDLPTRLLLGPGPSNVHPRVNLKLAAPMVGYMDSSYFKVMDEVMSLMKYLFQTDNEFTIPVSGAGSAAMEMCLANLIEPGDVVVVGIAGYFGERIYEMALRYGAEVKRVEIEWGKHMSLEEIKKALETHKPKLFCLVNGETSTGVRQEIGGVGELCRAAGSLLMVDTVASLGAVPFFVDQFGVDACYTGGQKCLSGPPGISPLTFSARAMEKIRGRKTPVANWYLDATMLASYWCPPQGTPRKYHHTTPANLLYALREALIVISEEGLSNVWARHQAATDLLYQGLDSIGIKPLVDYSSSQGGRLCSLTSVVVPEGVDAKQVQTFLLDKYEIEVAGGLGKLAGKIWRVGLMGYNARPVSVKLLLTALKEATGR